MSMVGRSVAACGASSAVQRQIGTPSSEMSFGKHLTPEEAERAWFASLLWRAFPEARSENELCEIAAEVLTKAKRPVTSRTIRNWLRRENTPHYRFVLAVIALVGAEAVFQILDPERPA
jgi:hypothetical protein